MILPLFEGCSDPPTPPLNAVTEPMITSSSIFQIGDAITYSCSDPTFSLANNISRCESSGLWAPSVIGICTQDGEEILIKNCWVLLNIQ